MRARLVLALIGALALSAPAALQAEGLPTISTRSGLTVALPPGWRVIHERLTPCTNPIERLTVTGRGALVMLQESLDPRPTSGASRHGRGGSSCEAGRSSSPAARRRAAGAGGSSTSATEAGASTRTSISVRRARAARRSPSSTVSGWSDARRSRRRARELDRRCGRRVRRTCTAASRAPADARGVTAASARKSGKSASRKRGRLTSGKPVDGSRQDDSRASRRE